MAYRDSVGYEIKKHIGVIGPVAHGWNKELNVVVWNGGQPKLDIRGWSEDHSHMNRGITLTKDEAKMLYVLLGEHFTDEGML